MTGEPDEDLQLLHGQRRPHCSARVDKHFVGYACLQLVTGGAVECWYNRRRWLLEPPTIWPTQPGPRIRFHPAPGHREWDHRYIALRGPRLDRWRLEGLWPNEPQAVPETCNAAGVLDLVYRLMDDPRPWAARRAATAIEGLLCDLALARDEPPEEPDWLAHAKEALASVDADDQRALARRLDMAPSTFRRRFHLATGMAPREWAMAKRMERARRLLIETDEPIAAIAAELGYRDPALFTRQFTARNQLSPRRFRATRLGA